MAESIHVKTTEQDYEIELIRSNRRSIALQVYPDGRIVCRAPRRATKREIIRFLDAHADWIAGAWEKLQKRIEAKKSRSAAYEIPAYESLTAAMRREIQAHFMERLQLYAPQMGVSYNRVTIRNQKGRWGSCSSKGNLNFNYRLRYLPQELMDYVVVHELAHRLEMNHSARFWNIVGKYDPKYREHQKMLTEIGINS